MKGKKVLFSSKSDEWATPPEIFEALDREFGFNLDPCATEENHKCLKFYTSEEDGLKQPWGGVQSVCQSALLKYIGMGSQGIHGITQPQHARMSSYPGKDRHAILPRVYPAPRGSSLHKRAFKVWGR